MEEKQLSKEAWKLLLLDLFKKRHIPYEPTFEYKDGIKIDFCYGARILVPKNPKRKYHLVVNDLDNNVFLYNGILDADDYFVTKKRYFINFGIQIKDHETGEKILQVEYNAKEKDVYIQFPVETLGDTLAWFNSAIKFQKKHQCNLFVRVADYIRPLLEPCYPDVHFITYQEADKMKFYASYNACIFHQDYEKDSTPVDYRTVPLNHCVDYILGTMPDEEKPKIAFDKDYKPIKKRYVVIASQASGGVKMWHNPTGWDEVVAFLKKSGYEVVDIDKHPVVGFGYLWNKIPSGAKNMTGDIELAKRASIIKNADFFIGLGSGLSWLSWALGKDTVLIGGFSEKWCEFRNPYRVSNVNVCHGCFNDATIEFDHDDFLWCPRHKGTQKQWECSVLITGNSVINTIKTIPVFQKRMEKMRKA